MPGRPSLRVLVGVGLVAGATLALQVLLTRLFSAVLFYHFSFLAISLALLGVGGGAVLVYVRPGWFAGPPGRPLARWSLVFAAVLAPLPVVLVRLDYDYAGITARFVGNLALACLLSALPFLAAGIVIALAVRAYAAAMDRLYFADLLGAAAGALLAVPVLWIEGAPVLIVALALLPAAAALLFAPPGRAARALPGAIGLGVAALLAVSLATSLVEIPTTLITPVAERWTPLARVVGFAPFGATRNGLVVYDRVIGEIVPHRRGAPLPGWRRLQEGPQSIGYELTGPGPALVIGGGGGRDILNALRERQRVHVIELNRGIRTMVDRELRWFSGAPYSLPGVTTTIGDGRSRLGEIDARYDTVHLGFTDTYSANSAQAFALTENNLYTVEAVEEYLDHLRPDGVLNLSRPDREGSNEALRVTVLALEALRRRGVADPRRNVVVITGRYRNAFNLFRYGTVLARPRAYTPGEVARVRALARARGGTVVMAPGRPGRDGWQGVSRFADPIAFCGTQRLDYCPPTDDRPFFFNLRRFDDLLHADTRGSLRTPDPMVLLAATLAILLVLSAAVLLAPLALVPRRSRPPLGSLGFFAAIGVGFLLLEVVLIQRFVLFLGFPTYALSVVLFSLLLFTGLGALVSNRGAADPRRRLTLTLGAALALIVAGSYGLQPLLRALLDLPFAARLACTVALLAPLAMLLGTAMPIGIRRLVGLNPGGVPWAWGVNGVASVVASALAVALAVTFGFAVTTLVAAGCYAVALAHVRWGAWPARSAAPAPAAPTAARSRAPAPSP